MSEYPPVNATGHDADDEFWANMEQAGVAADVRGYVKHTVDDLAAANERADEAEEKWSKFWEKCADKRQLGSAAYWHDMYQQIEQIATDWQKKHDAVQAEVERLRSTWTPPKDDQEHDDGN
jgi:hypothetical protein